MEKPASLNHQRFLANLKKSAGPVSAFAGWLAAHGRTVQINGMRYAPTRDDWREFSDGGDLMILKLVEVKQLSRVFSGPADWPFGDKFIVCPKGQWDRAQVKPEWVVILSADNIHAAQVEGRTQPSWTVEERTDHGFGMRRTFYLCPLPLVKWFKWEAP
jgi:hypothetical protein